MKQSAGRDVYRLCTGFRDGLRWLLFFCSLRE
jgi:hypothetical protein